MCGFVKNAAKKVTKSVGLSADMPKAPQTVTYAPAATVMNSDVSDTSVQGDANERERKKRGYNYTRSGLANILAGTSNKDTLG